MSSNNNRLPKQFPILHNFSFGSGDIRGIFGEFPINADGFYCIGFALNNTDNGLYSYDPLNKVSKSFLVIQDTRDSGKILKEALIYGLGNDLNILDCGVLPTSAAKPLLQKNPDIGFALIISASHNGSEFNGLKIFTQAGYLTSEQLEELNESYEHWFLNIDEDSYYPVETIDKPIQAINLQAQAFEDYKNYILQQFSPMDFLGFNKVVLDCANGAASIIAPAIFAALKINTVVINNQPDGQNINAGCGSTNPEVFREAVLENNACIGFSFDGDADRVVGCNKFGEIKDGDDILAVLSLSEKYMQDYGVVGTSMSNTALELFLAEHNKLLARSDVGVAAVMKEMQEDFLNLGGEPSGHILLSDQDFVSDGILVALTVLKALAQQQNFEFKTFKKFFSGLSAINTLQKIPLESPTIKRLEAQALTLLGTGRILLRYSQTEPVLRILVESQEEAQGRVVLDNLTQELKKLFNHSNLEK